MSPFPSRLAASTCLLAAALVAACASSGTGPPPRPGQEIATWVRMEPGVVGQTIYFRNDSDRELVVNQVEIYQCVNVRTVDCRFLDPNLRVPPAGVREAITVHPANRDKAFSFQYRYNYSEPR